jgi:hypothetical protein
MTSQIRQGHSGGRFLPVCPRLIRRREERGALHRENRRTRHPKQGSCRNTFVYIRQREYFQWFIDSRLQA